jgi:hypothetical protein
MKRRSTSVGGPEWIGPTKCRSKEAHRASRCRPVTGRGGEGRNKGLSQMIEPADPFVARIIRDIQYAPKSESHPKAIPKIQHHGWARLIHHTLPVPEERPTGSK